MQTTETLQEGQHNASFFNQEIVVNVIKIMGPYREESGPRLQVVKHLFFLIIYEQRHLLTFHRMIKLALWG